MAVLISRASGNFTATTTWKVVETALRAIQAVFTASTNTTTSDVHNANAQDFTIANGVTIEGIMLYCSRLTTTGTVRVTLSADSGTTATRTVTVNASDLPATPSWVFFEFASTLVGDGGVDYSIAVQGSTAGNAAFYRDATAANWAHYIGLSTNPGAIAAGDVFYVVGERTGAGAGSSFTVTMDSTAATDYGTAVAGDHTNGIDVGNGGILQYGTAAATNYILRLSGCLTVWGGGTFNMGTTGTPIPRDSTAVLEFDCTADGSFGLRIQSGGVGVLQGLSRTSGKNVSFARLTANEAAAATTIDVNQDTGWLNGDLVCFAPTGTTATEFETKTLNANAGASSFTLSAGLSFAHAGTAPRNGEVGLLTRNVRVRSVTSTLMSYVLVAGTATLDVDWVEFRYIGTNTTDKRGIETNSVFTGNLSLNHCSIYDGEASAVYLNDISTGVVSLTNLIIYNMNLASGANVAIIHSLWGTQSTSTGARTFTDICIIGATGNQVWGFRFGEFMGTVERLYISGFSGTTTVGIFISSAFLGQRAQSQKSIKTVEIHAVRATTASQGGAIAWSTSTFNPVMLLFEDVLVYDCVDFLAHSTLSAGDCVQGFFYNCQTIGTTVDIQVGSFATAMKLFFENCAFGGATEVNSQTNLREGLGIEDFAIYSTRHDQTDGEHRKWSQYGTIRNDNSIFRTASPSERLTPNNASNKLISGSKFVAVTNGQTVDISVYVRESVVGDGTDYNGARPRLILKKNPAMGITSDTVIDTATISSEGAFELLTGTTSAAARDGVLEFYVDCDGTTGWVNVDDWSAV